MSFCSYAAIIAFAIIKLKTNSKRVEVKVIPTAWFVNEEEECYWPKEKNDVAVKLVKEKAVPQPTWLKFAIRVLGKVGTNV